MATYSEREEMFAKKNRIFSLNGACKLLIDKF